MANLDTTAKRLMNESEFGCMAIHHEDGFVLSLKGAPVQLAYCLGRIIYDMHKQGNIPLKDVGIMVNKAVECLIEEEEKAK